MTTSSSGKNAYRPNVGIVLFNREGKVFVGERIDSPGAWQMPQGGIHDGEDIETAAMRELEEEIGTNRAEIIRISAKVIRYELPETLTQELWNGAYRGQEQTWAAARFTGEDTDIVLNAFDPPEFSAWQWVSLQKTPELIVPFKRATYEKVVAMFSDLATD